MNDQPRPPYVNYPGNPIMHPTLVLDDANMYGFFVKGNLDNLQATIDTCLNEPAQGKATFKALSPYVMVTFTHVGKAYSDNPPDREKGWITEIDIVTWIMVGKMVEDDGEEKLDHIYWFPHFIFVDSSFALINGREIYGYPKYLCQYQMPTQAGDPADYFSCSVESFKTFSPDTKLTLNPLMEIKQVGTENAWQHIVDVAEEGAELLRSIPDLLDMNINGIEQAIDMIFSPGIDQIYLKQFPTSYDETAAFQSIIHTPTPIKAIHSVSLASAEYKLTAYQVDSFPIISALGIKEGEQDVILPFHVNFDFAVGDGEVIAP